MTSIPLLRALVPALVLVVTAALLGPALDASAPLFGAPTLGLDQRDFRVFDNFSDPEANDNELPDPDFPGYVGAELAIWKSAVEWGSRLHGDGGGDPHQPGDLGSGGANFDYSFQGRATGPGGVNDNVHSEISSCGAGVVLFVEGGLGEGWRARYCSQWTFHDGPGTEALPSGHYDLQGAATFVHGLAAGLATNTVPGSTMSSVFGSSGGIERRSIEAADAAALQALYGVEDATKPRITSLAFAGGSLTITGEHFTPTGNEVWFTQRAAGGDGAPVKVAGVPSSGGGTSITVAVPAAAGPGDVLVKRSGSGNEALSNAWPFAPDLLGDAFCAAVPNSTGRPGLLLVRGSADVAADDLTLVALDLPAAPNLGYFLMGAGTSTFVPPGSAGPICVAPGLLRLLPPASNTAQGPGGFWREVGTSGPQTGQITGGSTWSFQAWHRDSAAATSNLTRAVSVTFL